MRESRTSSDGHRRPQAQRLRIPDQLAEHATPVWQLADRRPPLVVDANRDEALELAPLIVEDPERRVPSRRSARAQLPPPD